MHSQSDQVLYLSSKWTPDIDVLLENGLSAYGIKGSGKSNLVALLVEQMSRFLIPQIILDTENEYASLLPALPHGVLATIDSLPTAYDILTNGLQVIVSLQDTPPNSAALAIADLLYSLFNVASAQAPLDRVPCVIHTDEAGYWLPQKAVSYLSKETRLALLDAYSMIVSRGRKRGLVPFFYTQFISQVNKDVIRQSGLHVLMRQVQDIDIKRYGEYVALTPERREQITSFDKGEAVIHGLPDGSVKHVHFHERASAHVSHTPRARAAIAKFAGRRDEYDSLQSASTLPASTPHNIKAIWSDGVYVSDATKLLGRSRVTLYRLMKQESVKTVTGPMKPGTQERSMIARSDVERLRRVIFAMK